MKLSVRNQRLLSTSCFVALLLFAAPAMAQSLDKISPEVIEQADVHGTALVLVGLNVPWEMESGLSADGLVAQHEAIASIQSDLLTTLEGRNYKVLRRYQEIPSIALEVGTDALAELARLPIVTNVLLDRPAVGSANMSNRNSHQGQATVEFLESAVADKVPSHLYKRAGTNGTVLVLAGLRTPWQREDQLSEELLALQRTAIQDAQSYVLAELTGTRYKVMRLYRKIPGIALRVGVDALQVLEKSPAVTNVLPDRPAQASQ